MRIIIFGSQGSGKDTQADLISKKYNIPIVATGDLYRQEIQADTEIGEEAKKYIDQGKLVPDELTKRVLLNRLKKTDCQNGFVISGYPRNSQQAKDLEDILDQLGGARLDHAILLELSDQEAVYRIGGRRICKCGATYHLKFNPPQKEGRCDKCGGLLFIRDDDQEEAIKQRLQIYHQQTEPLLKFYEAKGILKRVNGEQPIPNVFEDISGYLK